MQDHDDRLTKRRITDNPVIGTDHKFPPGTPDSVLIADELESIKLLAEEANGDLDVPWGNSLKLDEDDWILRQIFRKSGLNPKRAGHWRLLLGILAEFQVDPNEYDDFKRGHVADDISSTRWKPDEREELLGQASALAIKHPKWGRARIAEELRKDPKWARTGRAWKGQLNKASAIKRVLEDIISEKRVALKEGKYDSYPAEKARVQELLAHFREQRRSYKSD
jgi:hypothetical protein